MSFANLLKNAPAGGKMKLKGGQSQGHVAKTSDNIFVNKFVPSLGKGSEYAAKFRLEDEKAYYESIMSSKPGSLRTDVTNGESSSQLFQPEELTSIGTVPNLQELNNEDLTQVYQNYEFNPVEPIEHLEPIFDEREQILRLIESNQVCIIKGPTGCGKSTQIPQFILDSYVKRHAHCNIVVTQPRRIAAITIAQHVCQERKWEVGSIVGYQVGLDKKTSPDTRLTYCTTGVLLEKIINTKNLNDYTHILLDEVHERDVDMDLTMLVVKLFLRKNSPNVKVVLMSATMDVTRFAQYYEVVLRDEKQPAPYYEIKRECKFTVQVHYLDALKNLAILPDVSEEEPAIAKEMYAFIPLMIRAFNSIDAEDYKCKRSLDEKGAVLIFLPGLYQIEILYELLQNEDKKDPTKFNLWICPLHSSITKDEQEKVRQYAPPGKRKVILSTNIAESSITIPDVKFVIDFCLTKHLVADQETGFTSLQLAWASHTNCIQREGRAGRVQDGRVYRMVPKSFYLLKMPKECVAEMQRCPLQIVVLKCKKMMEEECPLRLISNALDPPDLTNYENTVLKLKEVGALLTTCRGQCTSHDGDLTFFGRVMASLPLDIHITKLILLGHTFDVLEEAIIMGCAMSVRNIFSEPFQRRLESYNNKLLWADSSESDLVAYLNAYVVWRQLTGMGKFNRSGSSEQTWARRYMLQLKHLQEVAKQEADIKRRLKSLNIQVVRVRNKPLWKPQEKPLILKLVLAGAFYPHYYIRGAQNPNAESDAVKSLSGHSPFDSVFVQNMPHPAPIYNDQLRDCLKQNGISDDVLFFHNDSRKLIVTFNCGKMSEEQMVGEKHLNMNIPGEIVMPVYRAIKMRQLNIPIKIKTFHQSLIKEKLNMLSLHSRNSMRSLNSLDHKPKIPLNQQYIQIDVVYIDNASHFYAHVYPSRSELQHIHSILSRPDLMVELSGDVVDGFTYAAPYRDRDDEDFIYYRAHVKRKYKVQEVLWVDVLFIDYGNTGRMPAHELRELSSEEKQQELDSIPALALECTLAEVAPSVWSNQGAMWTEEANRFVSNVLKPRKYWYAKVYSYICGVASLYLYLQDNVGPSEKEPLTLKDELINKGFGRYKEESYFSKMNNAKRSELEQRTHNVEHDSSDTSSMTSSFKEIDLMSLPTTNSRALVELKGPNSPLEMILFSMAHCSIRKEVKVEGNSVNSVLLDSDPTDPHDRLLVAGSVSQTSDGRKLILNHTTVLPNMHGLAALVCLIFAPTVEYRTDDDYSRYTGALCGLGMKDNGVPLFSANDVEIKFDVEFTLNDLTNVNKLRYWINNRFCSPSAEDFPEAELLTSQKNIRTLTIDLLKTKRRSVPVHPNPYQFQWGKVHEERLLNPFHEDFYEDNSRYIYKLHKAIELQPNNDRKEVELLVNKVLKLENELSSGATPRVLRCDLCDADFEYCNLLRLHMTTNHHKNLEEWLKSRADAHKIPLAKQTQAKF